MIKKIIISIIVLAVLLVGVYFLTNTKEEKTNEATDSSLLEVKERGELIVGGDAPYGVMEFFNEEGEIVGIDLDIVNEIASRLGVKIKYIDYDWEPLFDAIKSGEIDFAASALTITAEREKEMLFSTPYFNGGQTLIVKADNDDIEKPEDLAGKMVGVQIESTGHYTAQEYVEDEMIKTYEDTSAEGEMIADLKKGITKAVVLDYIAAITLVKDDPACKIVGNPFTEEFYGMASRKDKKALMDEVDTILRDMKRAGMIKEIQDKWTK